MYPLHKSDDGSFQELARTADIEFGQLSLLTIAPRRTRGGHYHTHKKEWFCGLHGRCYIVATDVRTGEQRTIVMDEDNRKFAIVNPYEAHVVLNPSDQECELLVICNEEYDPDNADTVEHHPSPETCEVHGAVNCQSCKVPR